MTDLTNAKAGVALDKALPHFGVPSKNKDEFATPNRTLVSSHESAGYTRTLRLKGRPPKAGE